MLVRYSAVVIASSIGLAAPAHADAIEDVLRADRATPDADYPVVVHGHEVVRSADADEPPPPPCHTPLALVDTPAPGIDHTPGVDREVDLHWVGQVGVRIGSSVIDGVAGGVVDELLIGGGVHLDRMTLLGTYGVSLVHHAAATASGRDGDDGGTAGTTVDTDQSTSGVMHRLGAEARYAFWRAKSMPEVHDHDAQGVGEVFVTGGGGAEIIQWDLGGRLVRPEISVGVGILGAVQSSAHRRDGWFADFKVQVARRIDLQDAEPTCRRRARHNAAGVMERS